jgi:hypothetical protein
LSSDEEKLNGAIAEIEPLIRRNWKEKNPRLAFVIITPSQWLRVYDGGMKLHNEIIGFGSIEQLGKMRDMIINYTCFFIIVI